MAIENYFNQDGIKLLEANKALNLPFVVSQNLSDSFPDTPKELLDHMKNMDPTAFTRKLLDYPEYVNSRAVTSKLSAIKRNLDSFLERKGITHVSLEVRDMHLYIVKYIGVSLNWYCRDLHCTMEEVNHFLANKTWLYQYIDFKLGKTIKPDWMIQLETYGFVTSESPLYEKKVEKTQKVDGKPYYSSYDHKKVTPKKNVKISDVYLTKDILIEVPVDLTSTSTTTPAIFEEEVVKILSDIDKAGDMAKS